MNGKELPISVLKMINILIQNINFLFILIYFINCLNQKKEVIPDIQKINNCYVKLDKYEFFRLTIAPQINDYSVIFDLKDKTLKIEDLTKKRLAFHPLKNLDKVISVDNCPAKDIYVFPLKLNIKGENYVEKNYFILFSSAHDISKYIKKIEIERNSKLLQIDIDDYINKNPKKYDLFPELGDILKINPKVIECPRCIYLN